MDYLKPKLQDAQNYAVWIEGINTPDRAVLNLQQKRTTYIDDVVRSMLDTDIDVFDVGKKNPAWAGTVIYYIGSSGGSGKDFSGAGRGYHHYFLQYNNQSGKLRTIIAYPPGMRYTSTQEIYEKCRLLKGSQEYADIVQLLSTDKVPEKFLVRLAEIDASISEAENAIQQLKEEKLLIENNIATVQTAFLKFGNCDGQQF